MFSMRRSLGSNSASEASIKGRNGYAIHDLDEFYEKRGKDDRNADVITSVNEIVTKVARMKMSLTQKGKKVSGSKLLHILNEKPNKWESAYNFKFKVISESIMRGNSYIEIVRDYKGEVDHLRHLEFDKVVVRGMFSTYHPNTEVEFEEFLEDVEYQIVDGTTEIRVIKNENMIHLKPFNYGGVVGLSLIDCLSDELSFDNDAKGFIKHFMKTGGNVGGELKVVDPSVAVNMTDGTRDNLRRQFSKALTNYSGIYVSDGMYEFKPSDKSDKVVSSLIENKGATKKVGQMFNIPLHKLGISTSNMSLSQLNLDFINNTLSVYTEMFESEVNDKFFRVKEDFDSNIGFDTNSITMLDVETKTKIVREKVDSGLLTVNEGREQLGHERVDSEALDKYRVSLNYVNAEIVDEYQLKNPKGSKG